MTDPAKPAPPTILSIALEAVELGEKATFGPTWTPEEHERYQEFTLHAEAHYAALARAYVEVVGALKEWDRRTQPMASTPAETREAVEGEARWIISLIEQGTDVDVPIDYRLAATRVARALLSLSERGK